MAMTPSDDDLPPTEPPARVTGRAAVPGSAWAGEGGGSISGRARVGAPVSPAGPTGGSGPEGRGREGKGRNGKAGPAGAPVYKGGKRRPRWGRIALVVFIALALIGGVGAIAGYFYLKAFDNSIDRTDPFSSLTGDRPPKTVDGALNILMLGSDSRDPSAPVDKASTARTDTIVLMHIPAGHDKAYVISFPRDLYVFVPASADGQYGNTMAKINAAYAWGGLPLMVQTVEGYTGVRIDHVAVIDFGGFKEVVDALGGVDMTVEKSITSIHKPYRKFTKGKNHFNGAEALDYVRQRYQFADGDFARIRHQQQFLKAVMDKAASTGTLTNPGRLNSFLKALANALTVDKDFSIVDMALQFRNLRSGDLVFITSPNQGSANRNGESVVLGDKEKALALFDAVGKDQVAQWLARTSPSPKPSG